MAAPMTSCPECDYTRNLDESREEAEAKKVQQEEREKGEKARISAEEEISVADENKQRTVIVAARNKERTDAVEIERVERDRGLEATERELEKTVSTRRVPSSVALDCSEAFSAHKRGLLFIISKEPSVDMHR